MFAKYTLDFYEEAKVELFGESLYVYLGHLAWDMFKEEHPDQVEMYRHCWTWEIDLDGAEIQVILMKD
jgi:hypothetical protein